MNEELLFTRIHFFDIEMKGIADISRLTVIIAGNVLINII